MPPETTVDAERAAKLRRTVAAFPGQGFAVLDGARFPDLPKLCRRERLFARSLVLDYADAEVEKAGPWLLGLGQAPDALDKVLALVGDEPAAVGTAVGGAVGSRVGTAVGSGAGRWLDNRLGYGDQGTCAGHCMANTPADVLKGAKKDPKKPTLKDGTDQYVKDNTNGMPDAQKDFNSLNPQNVTTDENGTSVGNLSDGTQVVVRPKSVPSLEINPPTGTPVAIRYK